MIVIGVRGAVQDLDGFLKKVAQFEKAHSITLQFFRADRIFGAEHLASAAEKAVRAVQNGTAMSKTQAMEIMLYAAAERQTSEALRKLGIQPETTEMALVMIGEVPAEEVLRQLGLERDDTLLEPDGKDPCIFGIGADETETGATVPELVLERVALSEISR